MPRRIHLTLLVALVVGAGSLAQTVVAATPNQSILLYKPGTAVTGTLADGVFTRKRSISLTGVTHAAAGRDSLALYNRTTGVLRSGTFRNGIYTPTATRTVRTGYTRMVASCDTLLLYHPASGRALIGNLVQGELRHRQTIQLRSGFSRLGASCDSLILEDPALHRRATGVLVGGAYTEIAYLGGGATSARVLAGTATSLLRYDTEGCGAGSTCGAWGRFKSGVWNPSRYDASDAFGAFDLAAGTASTVLLYQSGGLGALVTLRNGVYAYVGARTFAAGYTLIVGGR